MGYVASYEVLKVDGEERFCEWDVEPGGEYQEVPKWLLPVRCKMDFLNMEAGGGRNQELFNYILTLQSNDYSVEETREAIRIIPDLSDAKRKEVLKYMNLICDKVQPADARYIAFRNGIYDVVTDTMQDFSLSIVITNRIPWDYSSAAFSELADHTLNRLACDDSAIRALLEECIGYCFYRRNELGKAFILTGDKNNGKSTFLEVVKAILHDSNISALDAKELGDRFTTSMMFGKLANMGDDILDDFMQGSQVSIFKKIVTGNRIKAERKGHPPDKR